MKVPLHVVMARRERLAQLIEQHRYLPIQELCRRLGVSVATARRDLAALAGGKRITRTFGGALSEFNDRFPSFRERQGKAARAKARIARRALALIEPNQTYFFDSGTTICALAEAFREKPVTPVSVVTSSLPVGEMLAAIPGVQVFQLAGQLLHLQSTLVGEAAQRSLEFWKFDTAFMSAEGMTPAGLWNSQIAIVEQQRVVLERSRRAIFCIDGSKLDRQAPHLLLAWRDVDYLLSDVPYKKLTSRGIALDPQCYISASAAGSAAGHRQVSEGTHAPVGGPDEMPVHIL